ncbi:MAG: hypothetical protein EOP89_11785 [Lysobacteraceae bacterium]|nr:MAG: hypothetical protein EOP89_11785 [Xanthomonadaceae bacterium]
MAKPVRPGTGTPHRKSKASLPENQNGTRFAEPVRASSPKSTASTGRTEDCTRPTRQIRKLRLHQGSHPQKTCRRDAAETDLDLPLFDNMTGTHFYTDSATERAFILQTRPDLVAEEIGFYEPGRAST